MFSRLFNLYWHIRNTRNKSRKRKYYRYVAVEKKRLIEKGVDLECLRLLCRHLVSLRNLKNIYAERSYDSYRKNCVFCR